MSWVVSLALAIVIVLIVMTAISDPVISYKYAGAALKSAIKLVNWCVKEIGNMIKAANQNTPKGIVEVDQSGNT